MLCDTSIHVCTVNNVGVISCLVKFVQCTMKTVYHDATHKDHNFCYHYVC